MKKNCQICSLEFELNIWNKKFCSDLCFKAHRTIERKKRDAELKLNFKATAVCVQCNIEFEYSRRKDRGDRIFCGRSCASKFYIKNGTFDKWRSMKNPKSGAYKKCLNKNCDSLVYLEKRFVDTNKCRACSKECRTQHISRLFSGKGNPMFGKKLTEQQLKKQKETLQKNYPGTLNAFSLSKKRKKTRPQIEIYNFLVEKYPDFNFQIEKRISQNETKVIFADIVSLDKKIVVEFNGDYWHRNPKF